VQVRNGTHFRAGLVALSDTNRARNSVRRQRRKTGIGEDEVGREGREKEVERRKNEGR
jgi:hypothetical protein